MPRPAYPPLVFERPAGAVVLLTSSSAACGVLAPQGHPAAIPAMLLAMVSFDIVRDLCRDAGHRRRATRALARPAPPDLTPPSGHVRILAPEA